MAPHREVASSIAKAKTLIAAKDVDGARKLLLEEGYTKRTDAEVQAAYLQLIPVTATLREMLSTIYADLSDSNVAARRKAIMAIARELSRETVRDNVFWMRDPRAADPIIAATEDPDATVVTRALAALMRLVYRFFPDQRSAPAFLAHLGDKQQVNRFNAISGISCLRQEALLTHLVTPFESGSAEDRAQVAAQIWGWSMESPHPIEQEPIHWSAAGRKFWRKKMLDALSDASVEVRKNAARALQRLGDSTSIVTIEAARDKESDADVRYFLDETLATLRAA